MESKDLMIKITDILSNRKVDGVKVLNIGSLTTIADYFVICTANSTTQSKSLADEIETKLKDEDIPLYGKEGFTDASWILLDYSSVIVHIFNEEMRNFYDIENLWADATVVDIGEYTKD